MANKTLAARQKAELESLFPPWVQTLGQRSKNTARAYEKAVGDFLKKIPDGEVSPDHVGAYLDSLQRLAPASRAHHISAVRAFLMFAQRQSALKTSLGAIATSLLDYLQRPTVDITSYNRYLDKAELKTLVRAARELGPRHLGAVLLLAYTGIRVGEAVNAKWKDLYRDPDGRLGLRVTGKGNKSREVKMRADLFDVLVLLHGGADALDGRDTTPLLPAAPTTHATYRLALPALRAEREALDLSQHDVWQATGGKNKKNRAAAGIGVTSLSRIESGKHGASPTAQNKLAKLYQCDVDELFAPVDLSSDGQTPMAYTTRGLYTLITEAAGLANIAKPISPHWLRHSHATLAAKGGASTFVIQSSLGHAQLETSNRYVHMANGLAETTVDWMPSLT